MTPTIDKVRRYQTKFEDFLYSPLRTMTIEVDDAKAYVRKSVRVLPCGCRVDCFDLATIQRESRATNVRIDPDVESTGFFGQWMDAFERAANVYNRTVVVESVMNEWMHEWLERRGYQMLGIADSDTFCVSYYKQV